MEWSRDLLDEVNLNRDLRKGAAKRSVPERDFWVEQTPAAKAERCGRVC